MAETLASLVEHTPRFRQRLDPTSLGGSRVILTGRPEAWPAALSILDQAGASVAAFHSRKPSARTPIRDVPLLRGDAFLRDQATVAVFAGKPTKHFFNPCGPGLERCRWSVPPEAWQEVGRHTPRIWDVQRGLVEEAFRLLADDESRATFASIVRSRLEGDTGFHRISRHVEYDHPVVHASPGDIVIDAGAYDGDTPELYSRRVGRRGRVFALEPSPRNYGRLVRRLRDRQLTNVVPMLLGAWDDDGVLRFASDAGASSKIDDSGGTEIVVTSIDKLVRDHRIPKVDLLKLDVEGAEKRALQGAEHTLKSQRPLLHISIYHRFDDLFELPLLLSSWLPRYRWYVGHHSFYQMETDLYGIPVERWIRGRAQRTLRRWIRHGARALRRE